MSDEQEQQRKVVITGVGVVSAAGIGNDEFWERDQIR